MPPLVANLKEKIGTLLLASEMQVPIPRSRTVLPDVSHSLMTVSRQFAHIMIHVLVKSVRVHHVVAWVLDGAQSVDILLLPFCTWFSMVSPMMQASS